MRVRVIDHVTPSVRRQKNAPRLLDVTLCKRTINKYDLLCSRLRTLGTALRVSGKNMSFPGKCTYHRPSKSLQVKPYCAHSANQPFRATKIWTGRTRRLLTRSIWYSFQGLPRLYQRFYPLVNPFTSLSYGLPSTTSFDPLCVECDLLIGHNIS